MRIRHTAGQLARDQRNRLILVALAAGYSLRAIGEMYQVSHTRVRQIRAEMASLLSSGNSFSACPS